jgi:chromate transport protein ChrA
MALCGYMQRDLVATSDTLCHLWWYFAAAGAFVFGTGLAIVPFLYGGVVERFQWLTERQFLFVVVAGALAAIVGARRVPEPLVILGAAAVGLALGAAP